MAKPPKTLSKRDAYLRSLTLLREDIPHPDRYPFAIPALRELEELDFDPRVTFLVGENGSGKSTLLEALAVKAGFNAEGGSKNFHFATCATESELHRYLRLARGIRRPRDGFFFRAESFYNVATHIDELDSQGAGLAPLVNSYGGKSLHDQSHGESFLSLVTKRFRGQGLYLLDEPEAALSPARQLGLLAMIDRLVKRESQFIIATHSPIVLAYPGATIYHLDAEGPKVVDYEDTEHFRITHDFLVQRHSFLAHLLDVELDPDDEDDDDDAGPGAGSGS